METSIMDRFLQDDEAVWTPNLLCNWVPQSELGIKTAEKRVRLERGLDSKIKSESSSVSVADSGPNNDSFSNDVSSQTDLTMPSLELPFIKRINNPSKERWVGLLQRDDQESNYPSSEAPSTQTSGIYDIQSSGIYRSQSGSYMSVFCIQYQSRETAKKLGAFEHLAARSMYRIASISSCSNKERQDMFFSECGPGKVRLAKYGSLRVNHTSSSARREDRGTLARSLYNKKPKMEYKDSSLWEGSIIGDEREPKRLDSEVSNPIILEDKKVSSLSRAASIVLSTFDDPPAVDLQHNAPLIGVRSKYCKTVLYEPLDTTRNQVRLLRLLPPSKAGGLARYRRIRCHLLIRSLNSCPDYEALSYTWGSPTLNRMVIRVNGNRFLVRSNLALALEHLRDDTNSRILWIDAICINQENVSERNHQVGQMGEIYRRASQVLVWLGQDSSNLSLRGQKSSNTMKKAVWCIKELADTSKSRYDRPVEFYDDSILLSLASLCVRPYWNRLWIVQEVLLARKLTIYAGTDNDMSFSWDEWSKARKALENIPAEYELSRMVIDVLGFIASSLPVQFDKQRDQGTEGWPLHTLLSMCRSSLCQDPHDKIYGLLGLAADFQPGDIVIDYSKSLFDLYIDIIEFHNSSHHKRQASSLSTMAFSQIAQIILDGPIEVPGGMSEPLIPLNHQLNHIQAFDPMAPPEQTLQPRVFTTSKLPKSLTKGAFSIEGFKRGTVLPLDILADEMTIRDLQQRDSLCVLVNYIPHLSTTKASLMLERLEALAIERNRIITMRVTRKKGQFHSPRTTREEAHKDQGTSFFVTSFGEFGFASTAIREDDILCRFSNCDVGVVVRKKKGSYCLVSQAVLAPEDVDTSAIQERHEESMSFWVDPFTMQDLTCPIKLTDKHKHEEHILDIIREWLL